MNIHERALHCVIQSEILPCTIQSGVLPCVILSGVCGAKNPGSGSSMRKTSSRMCYHACTMRSLSQKRFFPLSRGPILLLSAEAYNFLTDRNPRDSHATRLSL